MPYNLGCFANFSHLQSFRNLNEWESESNFDILLFFLMHLDSIALSWIRIWSPLTGVNVSKCFKGDRRFRTRFFLVIFSRRYFTIKISPKVVQMWHLTLFYWAFLLQIAILQGNTGLSRGTLYSIQRLLIVCSKIYYKVMNILIIFV